MAPSLLQAPRTIAAGDTVAPGSTTAATAAHLGAGYGGPARGLHAPLSTGTQRGTQEANASSIQMHGGEEVVQESSGSGGSPAATAAAAAVALPTDRKSVV